MQMKIVATVAFLTLLAGGLGRPVSAQGQSLADVARQEEARRKALRDPSKVLTNRDLLPPPVGGTQPAETGKNAASAKAGDGKGTAKAVTAEPAKDQPYWAGRIKTLQDKLESDQAASAAVQAQIDGLMFDTGGDPARRAVVDANRQKAIAELARLKAAVAADQTALTDFADEARRAAVPPGWLR
jgi:hypothetical protein